MVTVSLTGTSKEDATTVFGILQEAFPTDNSRDALLQEPPGDHPAVWTGEFEPTQERVPAGPTPLGAPVTATLQGAYAAVDRLCEALGDSFAVQEKGTASGDQEKEVELLLGTKQ
ncbi:hypothetical protein ACFVGN_34250 [Streptomyces sp. NPDC057757]|uniref:hypothetical protein n=1 Tax=Streptomyces sp. NPDC057757 TaxID=3346241 RepID=UPI0036B7D456